jgi:hypothetical protein
VVRSDFTRRTSVRMLLTLSDNRTPKENKRVEYLRRILGRDHRDAYWRDGGRLRHY